jgi:heparan-alpha-glucosaminide N-acetyltransferase
MHSTLTAQRIFSIDTFRGITILVMIFVNELAGVRGIPEWMKHMPADADAMTFVDVVFPAFLFIVGMSIPFAIINRKSKGDSLWQIQKHILIRTAGLLVLGVFMVNAEGGYNEEAMGMSIGLWLLLFYGCVILVWNVYTFETKWVAYVLRAVGIVGLVCLALLYRAGDAGETGLTPQWWGILGLIGWAYLISCILYQVLDGNKFLIMGAAIACLVWYMIGDQSGSTSFIIHWLGSQKGHAAHTSIVLSGIVVSLIFFDEKRNRTVTQRIRESLVLASLFLVAGVLLRPYYPISKIFATPTWCLFCSAICIVIFAFLYWIIDLRKSQRWAMFFKPAASNPLLTYIIPYIIYAILNMTQTRLPDEFHTGFAGILWSLVFAVSIMAFVIVLNKWKIRLQL